MANFSADLANLRPSAIYANSDFVADNPGAAQAYLEALLEQHAKINSDPSYLADLAIQYLGGDLDDWTLVADAYVSNGLYNAAALTEENLAYTISFFEAAGVIEPGLTPADIAVLGPMQAAAAAVGN
jgi:NitT/TauT family transport system substrate-binding protein